MNPLLGKKVKFSVREMEESSFSGTLVDCDFYNTEKGFVFLIYADYNKTLETLYKGKPISNWRLFSRYQNDIKFIDSDSIIRKELVNRFELMDIE